MTAPHPPVEPGCDGRSERPALPSARPRLSLVFPVFDEEENLGPLLDGVLRLAPQLASSFEIILVDDGSRDGSFQLIESRRREHSSLRLVQHPANRGYGAALRSGLKAARGELVFFSDADLQFDLGELATLLERVERVDIVAGYRAPRRDPWRRRAIARLWGLLIRALFGLHVRDIDCAFKIFRRVVIDTLPIASIGAFVNTEILVRAQQAGFRIQEVPVSHRPRHAGRAKGARLRVILRALAELLLLYRELRPRGRPSCASR